MSLTSQASSTPPFAETATRVTGRRAAAALIDVLLLFGLFFAMAKIAGTADLGGGGDDLSGDDHVSIRLENGPAVLWVAP